MNRFGIILRCVMSLFRQDDGQFYFFSSLRFSKANFSKTNFLKLGQNIKRFCGVAGMSALLGVISLPINAQDYDRQEISAIQAEEKPHYHLNRIDSRAEGFVVSRRYNYFAGSNRPQQNQGFQFNVNDAQLSYEVINESEARSYLPAGEYWVVALNSERIRFVKEGEGFKVFKMPQSRYHLSQEGNGWLFKKEVTSYSLDGVFNKDTVSYQLDSSGRLIEYQDKTNHHVYEYTGLTTTIQGLNDSEEVLWQMQLEKDADGRVVGLVNPQGVEKRYEYDSKGRLVAAVYADNTEGWHDNPRELYLYEDTAHPNLITQIVSPLKDVSLKISLSKNEADKSVLLVQELPERAPRPKKSSTQESIVQTTTSWANGVSLIVKDSERSYQYNGLTISKEEADELLKDIRHYWIKQVVDYDAEGCDCQYARGSIRREESRENGWRRQVISEWSDGRKQVTDYTKEDNVRGFVKSITLTQGNTLLNQKIYTGTRENRLLSEETSVLKMDYTYDMAGRAIKTTRLDKTDKNAKMVVNSNVFNAEGHLIKTDGVRDDVKDIERNKYNARGQLIKSINALGHITMYKYDSQHRLIATIDANGVREETHYGQDGRVAQRIRAAGTSQALATHYFYDAVGQLVQAVTGDVKSSRNQFDAYGRLESTQDASGNATQYHYDNEGNLVKRVTKDINGDMIQQTEYEFDAQGRVVLDKTTGTQMDYLDDNRQPTKVLNGEGNQILNQYDSEGRLSISFDADEQPTYYEYDSEGHQIKVTDARRIETRYTYDGFGRRLSETSGSKGTITYQYDAAGNIVKETRENGIVIKNNYDALNRVVKMVFLKKETDSSGKKKSVEKKRIVFKYDNCENGVGRLCIVKGAGSTTRYDYDVLGNRTQVKVKYDNQPKADITRFQYNSNSQLTHLVYPSGLEVEYHYAENGNVNKVTAKHHNQTYTVANIESSHQLNAITFGNGLTQNFTHNEQGQLTQITTGDSDTQTQQVNYVYDKAGNISQIERPLNTNNTQTFEYDKTNRLVKEITDTMTQSFEYDTTGNRTKSSKTEGDTNTTKNRNYVYKANANQLQQINKQLLTYDANGNLIEDRHGKRRFEYDVTNRLTVYYKNGEKKAEYTYNTFGQRIQKVITRNKQAGDTYKTLQFSYLPEGWLLTEDGRDENNNRGFTRDYIWLDDKPIAQIHTRFNKKGKVKKQNIIYIHTDHLNTPRLATNQNQETVWSWQSTAFGEGKANRDVDGDGKKTVIRLRFPGQYFDSESRLHYNHHRDYDPKIGRYIQSDPIGLDGGINRYAYVLGNPLSYTDPKGLVPGFGIPAEFVRFSDWLSSLSFYGVVGDIAGLFGTRPHYYEQTSWICNSQIQECCTPSNVFENGLLYGNAPTGFFDLLHGQSRDTPVSQDEINFAWPVGYVRTDIDINNLQVINTTTDNHILNSSSLDTVTRRIVSDQSGNIYIETIGTGNGALPGINEGAAGLIWGSLDTAVMNNWNERRGTNCGCCPSGS